MSEPVPFPQPRFGPPMDEPAGPAEITPSLIEMARAVAAICATRVLLLLAVLISGVVWIWAVADPTQIRTVAATAYSVVTVWPLTALFWRRG
jgi:hypothetical protein